MDDLRDEHVDESENADALLDDSIFEEVDLDLIADEEDLLSKPLVDDADEDEEEEEILDELDALAAEEEEEEFDFYGDEEEF